MAMAEQIQSAVGRDAGWPPEHTFGFVRHSPGSEAALSVSADEVRAAREVQIRLLLK